MGVETHFLLPGLVAAWVFYGLTAHPKEEWFERVVQALIFTVIVRAMNIGTRKAWWVFYHSKHASGRWTDDKELVWSLFNAILLGLVVAVFANHDWAHRCLRKLKITQRTSYPSEWYSGFHRFRRDVILHLKGERRLMGWADEWPDQCERGHFLIQKPIWLSDTGEKIPLLQLKRLMIPASDVEMVEFIHDADELTITVEDIVQSQAKLIEMHRPNKEADNGNGRSGQAESASATRSENK